MHDIDYILLIGRRRGWLHSLKPVVFEPSKDALKIVERAKCFYDLNDTVATLTNQGSDMSH